jgi:hypothetical protein
MTLHLFNSPQYIAGIDQRAEPMHMPLALTRSQLAADLDDYRAQYWDRPEEIRPSCSRFYGPDRGLNVAIWPQGNTGLGPTSIPPSRVLSMDLSQWNAAFLNRQWNASLLNRRLKKEEDKSRQMVAIDVELGRLALLPIPVDPETNEPIRDEHIRVTYCYGFSTTMGGGPYHRDLRRLFSAQPPFYIDVAKGSAAPESATDAQNQPRAACVPTLRNALDTWDKHMVSSASLTMGCTTRRLRSSLTRGPV